MNYGALFFLVGFFALASSWVGLVLAPQLQVGRQDLTTVTGTPDLYPQPRPGMAAQGAQVYRANGCMACHSQQVRQSGTVLDVVLNEVGTNQPAVLAALQELGAKLDAADLDALPKDVLRGVDPSASGHADLVLKPTGAKYSIRVRPVGPDIERGWGRRGTVAQDYLRDNPVMLGSQRLGPDLANIGIRQPDANWHLNHLYAPKSVVPESTMPPYRFLFEKRKVGRESSPEALNLTGEFAPEPGYEIVPTDEARALVAYLKSLRADEPLFVAPMSVK